LLIWATRGMGVRIRLGTQVLGHIKSSRARQLLTLLSEQLVSPHLASHADAVKPLLLSGPARPIKTIPAVPLKAGEQLISNPVAM
ncbi:hypothetical protein Q5O12_27325, partial [Klebsiella pneumoniae]